MRQVISTALVAIIVSLLTVTAVGVLAQDEPATTERTITPAAGINAATVDGKSAISATSKAAKRANKLVAANKYGYLPGNIVKPKWSLIQGMPLGFADGVDDVGYTSWVLPDTFSVGATPMSVLVSYSDPVDGAAQMLPIAVGDEVIVTEETYKRTSDVGIGHYYRIERHPSSTNATVQFKVRVRVFYTGIAQVAASAALRKAIKDEIVVKVVKARG